MGRHVFGELRLVFGQLTQRFGLLPILRNHTAGDTLPHQDLSVVRFGDHPDPVAVGIAVMDALRVVIVGGGVVLDHIARFGVYGFQVEAVGVGEYTTLVGDVDGLCLFRPLVYGTVHLQALDGDIVFGLHLERNDHVRAGHHILSGGSDRDQGHFVVEQGDLALRGVPLPQAAVGRGSLQGDLEVAGALDGERRDDVGRRARFRCEAQVQGRHPCARDGQVSAYQGAVRLHIEIDSGAGQPLDLGLLG